jgi:predicted RNA binding protein YcfA (HicA-like mRNA interferase family)
VLSTVVVLGKREIPRGTLRSILRQLDISLNDFLKAL